MIDFLKDYGLFVLKAGTIVFAVMLVISSVISALRRGRAVDTGRLFVSKINEHYDFLRDSIAQELVPAGLQKKVAKEKKKQRKLEAKKARRGEIPERRRLFVIDFKGDVRASALAALREEVTAILTVGSAEDEVVVRLESAGGMVYAYGLAASQLQRLRDKKIPLTVAVDKLAASGGYMMACVADRLLAAPFAVIGSIGVASEMPNFHRLLKKHDIDFEEITAGEYKRTLTMFGENTKKGRQKFIEQIEETHQLFKEFVHQHRPVLDMEAVSTGEYWYGKRALDLKLVDDLVTSDDYLLAASAEADIYTIEYKPRESLTRKIVSEFEEGFEALMVFLRSRAAPGRFL